MISINDSFLTRIHFRRAIYGTLPAWIVCRIAGFLAGLIFVVEILTEFIPVGENNIVDQLGLFYGILFLEDFQRIYNSINIFCILMALL